MYILQALIFNKEGTDIVGGDAWLLDSEAELNELSNSFIEDYKTNPEWDDLGLVLINNTTGKMLYNSNEEK